MWKHINTGSDACNHGRLTHWGRATHICVSKLTIIASDNGLAPTRRQAIIWNNAWILSIGLLGTNFSEILIEILTFSFKKMRLKVSSAKWRPFCLGLNVLTRLVLKPEYPGRTKSWRRHRMETFSASLALFGGNSPVTGGFPSQRPVTWRLCVFFDLRLNKRLSKQLSRRWFKTPSRSLWRHRNG